MQKLSEYRKSQNLLKVKKNIHMEIINNGNISKGLYRNILANLHCYPWLVRQLIYIVV